MFKLYVLQNQWLMLAIGIGLIVVLGFALASMAFWRRETVAGEQSPWGEDKSRRGWAFMPWFLIVSYAFILVYAVAYTIMKIYDPPNW